MEKTSSLPGTSNSSERRVQVSPKTLLGRGFHHGLALNPTDDLEWFELHGVAVLAAIFRSANETSYFCRSEIDATLREENRETRGCLDVPTHIHSRSLWMDVNCAFATTWGSKELLSAMGAPILFSILTPATAHQTNLTTVMVKR
jgi:hypothetical protein